MNNLLDILKKSINYLEMKNVKNARIIVEKIFADVLKMDRIMLYANFERELNDIEKEEVKTKLNEKLNEKANEKLNEKNLEINKNKDIKKINTKNNLKELIDKSVIYLEKNNISEAKLITEIIFSHVLKMERLMLFTRYSEEIEEEKMEKIRKMLFKIGKEKFPIQYLLNEQEFYGRSFYVNKGVLIPRQDTETLVETVINLLIQITKTKTKNPKILDIGTGSGIIGITIAIEIPEAKIIGVDISEKALEISNKNKEIHKVDNINFVKSDLFENIEYKKFDIIVSNPPYIASDEMEYVGEDTLLHEPTEALFASNEGLYFYYKITEQSLEYLKDDGFLCFEIGFKQGEKVKEILEKFNYKNVEIIKDLNGQNRVVIGQKENKNIIEKERE